MKSIKNICLAVSLGLLSIANLTAYASEQKYVSGIETSEYSVEYGREVEKDRDEECEVYIAVPWEFSDTIPKTPVDKTEEHPVQTGDGSGAGYWTVLLAISGAGICGTACRKKNSK